LYRTIKDNIATAVNSLWIFRPIPEQTETLY